jgi:hypothetical protein
MTDQMVMPGVKKCGKCDTWRPVSDFSASSDAADGLQAWCKRCHKEYKGSATTKGLDVSDEQRREWLALGPLEKQQAIDGAWTNTAMALVKMVKIASDRQKELTKESKRLNAEARVDALAKRIVKALAERKLKALRDQEEAHRRITKAKQEIAENQQRRDELTARVKSDADDLAAQLTDLSRRLTLVQTSIEAPIELQKARNEAADRSRAERDRAEWVFKANSTSDPTLRAVYLARAEGQDVDDDE